ncbi:MAG: hypothetical protein Q9212_001242 [Teloschistes hypoglaucus]
MKRHANQPDLTVTQKTYDLDTRMAKAMTYLQKESQLWDVGASVYIAFELLVPAHLSMLQDEGITLDFPQKSVLMNVRAKKVARLDPSNLYGPQKSTLLYSLESLIGRIDFDRVQHHLTLGSQMGSPSSTVAYLMSCSSWDIRAEDYLRDAIANGAGHGCGGVTGTYPTCIFEITWGMSTLHHGGFVEPLQNTQILIDSITYLDKHMRDQEGLVGFSPYFLPDADDTAKSILMLNVCGHRVTSDQMLSHFNISEGLVRTFFGERNACFSTNYHVLMALLNAPEPQKYSDQIERIVEYLCDCWSSGPVKDKWWMILASVIEGFSYYPQLKEVKTEVFPHQDVAEDTYLEYIPCTWTIINNRLGLFLEEKFLWDVMLISALNFQLDEYMESVAGQMTEDDLKALQRSIPQLIACIARTDTDDQETKTSDKPQNEDSRSLSAVEQVLGHYVTAVLFHRRIQKASSFDRSSLHTELQTFLHPSLPSTDVFDSGYTKYLAEDVSSHVAVMVRLSNDYGSITRDESECNINSVNFPEFQVCTNLNTDLALDEAHADKQQTRQAKGQLLRLVQYEKRGVDEACATLFESLDSTSKKAWNTRDAVELFVGVAKMYADLYGARDISNRVK